MKFKGVHSGCEDLFIDDETLQKHLNNWAGQYFSYDFKSYIGLKDKNGDEIYLDDDVKFDYADMNKPCTIDFQNGCFGVKFYSTSPIYLVNPIKFYSFMNATITIIDNCIQEIELIKE